MKALTRFAIAGLAAAMATGLAGTAQAQLLGLGTAQAGATLRIGQEVARIVSQNSDMQMRSQGFASTGQYGPMVNAGALDFGLSNVIETNYLYNGRELANGQAQEDLRLVMVLYPLPITFFATHRSGVTAPEQLYGKRVPTGWTSQPLGRWLWQGFFANHNLDYSRVNSTPVTAMPRQWDMVGQNQLDASFSIFGSAFVEELTARAGGINYMNADDSPEAVERMREYLPYAYVTEDYNKNHDITVKNISYDFVVFTNSKMSDDVVYNVVKALYENSDALEIAYQTEGKKVRFAVESGIPFHPGAERFYREVGLWPPQEND